MHHPRVAYHEPMSLQSSLTPKHKEQRNKLMSVEKRKSKFNQIYNRESLSTACLIQKVVFCCRMPERRIREYMMNFLARHLQETHLGAWSKISNECMIATCP